MIRLIKQVFTGLLRFSKSITTMANASDYAKCTSLYNQPCRTQPTLINLHLHEYT